MYNLSSSVDHNIVSLLHTGISYINAIGYETYGELDFNVSD